jgi:RNA polymerase sigma-70 factor, ECF subfamily
LDITIRQNVASDISSLEAMLGQIMLHHGTQLSILAFSYVKNVERAKDIVQNVLLNAT